MIKNMDGSGVIHSILINLITNFNLILLLACPNGGNECKYRHALPPGYILKKKETGEERMKREEDEKENQITIEDFLETEVI